MTKRTSPFESVVKRLEEEVPENPPDRKFKLISYPESLFWLMSVKTPKIVSVELPSAVICPPPAI